MHRLAVNGVNYSLTPMCAQAIDNQFCQNVRNKDALKIPLHIHIQPAEFAVSNNGD